MGRKIKRDKKFNLKPAGLLYPENWNDSKIRAELPG
jgi:hypothetical protein